MKLLALAAFMLCQAAPQAKEIDNPEYVGWKDLKVGSWVKLKTVTDMEGMKSETTTTQKLTEITKDKAVVELTIVVSVMGQNMVQPTQTVTHKAKRPEDQLSDDAGGKFTKTAEGDDEIEVSGKKLKCHFLEGTFEVAKDGMTFKGKSKTWFHKDVIGGIAKASSTIEEPMKIGLEITVTDSKKGE